jgi:hypothetical protein
MPASNAPKRRFARQEVSEMPGGSGRGAVRLRTRPVAPALTNTYSPIGLRGGVD